MNICINFFSRFCKYFLGFPTVSNIIIILSCKYHNNHILSYKYFPFSYFYQVFKTKP